VYDVVLNLSNWTRVYEVSNILVLACAQLHKLIHGWHTSLRMEVPSFVACVTQ
jgi:hypothetical protein